MSETSVIMDVSLLPHQIPVFNAPESNIVYVKGRRAGGTEGLARKVLATMVQEPGTYHLWIDTVYRNISRYIKRYFYPRLRNLPRAWWSYNGADCTLNITIPGHETSLLDFGSAERSENIEGFGYSHIWLNEAGHILWNETLYYETLLPMGIEGKGARWNFVGAPKGKNLFHTFFLRGQDPEQKDWVSFQHDSYTNPIVNKELLGRYSKEMPRSTYESEILAQFTDDGAFFQGVDGIVTGTMQEKPTPAAEYVVGLDLGRENDFTVNWVGRIDTREAVLCDRYTKLPWPEQVAKIKELSIRFHNARVLVDATGFGGLIALDDLWAAGVPAEEFTFTNKSKLELLGTLATDIEQQRISIYNHQQTINELKALQRTILPHTGTQRLEAPPGMHDDCVMSLALMNKAWGRVYMANDGMVINSGIGAEMDMQF